MLTVGLCPSCSGATRGLDVRGASYAGGGRTCIFRGGDRIFLVLVYDGVLGRSRVTVTSLPSRRGSDGDLQSRWSGCRTSLRDRAPPFFFGMPLTRM